MSQHVWLLCCHSCAHYLEAMSIDQMYSVFQTKYVAAKESYESFLQLENLDFSLKATALRQLGVCVCV